MQLHAFLLRFVLLYTLFLGTVSSRAAIDIRARQLSAANGLGANYIRSITQDAKGYIWLGATNGLIRYDGYHVENISQKANRELMPDDRVQRIELWKDRFIWISLRGRHYSCYDTEQECFVDYTGNGSYQESYKSYRIMPNGDLWLIDPVKGCKIIRFDGHHFTSQQTKEMPKDEKTLLPAGVPENAEIHKDNRGNIIAMTRQGDIWHIDAKSSQTTHLSGLYSEQLLRLNGEPRYGVVTDRDGIIWVSTYGNGLFVYNPKNGEMNHVLKNVGSTSPIQTNYLLNIFEDRVGNIWLCQENMGVVCLSKQNAEIGHVYFTSAEQIDHTNSIHLLTRVGATVYIGNRYNGLKLADGMLNITESIDHFHDDVVAVCGDLQGKTWMGTRNSGVYVGNSNYRHDDKDDGSLAKGKISDIVCDQKGRIWISFFDSGVDMAVSDGKGGYRFLHFFMGEDAILHPRKMMIDHAGYIWLTSDQGLHVFHPDQLVNNAKAYITVGRQDASKPIKEVYSICETSAHEVYAATMGFGIIVLDNNNAGHPSFKEDITIENGLPNNNVHLVKEDGQHGVWAGTDYGLAYYNENTHGLTCLVTSDIPQGNIFVENAVCRLDNGSLAFGTHHGVVIVNPARVGDAKPAFPLRITDLYINGSSYRDIDDSHQPTMNDGTLTLDYSQNSLTFHFSDFKFVEGQEERYQYRLSGYDKDWAVMTPSHPLAYRNLPPGRYTLEVRSQDGNSTTSMTIDIRPPFWATWWAYLIYIGIVAIATWMVFRHFKRINELHNRIKVEEQLTAYKIQFFTNISHEFRTPLTIIRGAMDHITGAKQVPADMRQPVSSMQRSVNRLMRMINQLMEFSKMHEGRLRLQVEETDVVAFVRDIFLTFREMAEQKDINYQFTTSHQSYLMLTDQGMLDKITYNLISNAFKYTPAHHSITVRTAIDEQTFHLVVEDTGIGIDKEKQQALFTRFNQSSFAKDSIGIGLHLTQELVRVHHGTISYAENPEGGSIFTITLPVDKSLYSTEELMGDEQKLLKEGQVSEIVATYKEMAPEPMNDIKVLIVEDDHDVREHLSNELQRYFVIQRASDGAEALEIIRQERPDLIISDVMMPIMNGYELTKKLRSDEDTADIPIILLTALDSEEKMVKGLDCGADAYITKPFSTNVLIARCTQLLQQRRQLRVNYAKEVVNKSDTPAIIVEEQEKRLRAQLDTWLNAHLRDRDLNIDTFAQKMGYGRTTFYKKMKKLTGKTPNDYIRNLRMEKALELLKDDTVTIAEVSYEVGIEDPYYFSKTFKAFYGISPSQYRKGEKPTK